MLLFWTLVVVLPFIRCCARAGQVLRGSKEENAICKILAGIRDQLPMSSYAAVTQDIRLPDPWKRFVPESPGRLRHACTVEATGNPRFMAQLAQSQRNLNTVIPGGIEYQEFPVCISDLGARLPTRFCFFMDESGGDRLNSAENLGARHKVETGVAFPGPDSGQSPSNERATEAESSFSDSPSRWSPPSK